MDIKLLMDCIKSPVKSQIILCLQKHEKLTAKDLLNITNSIPQATLYRALKKMEHDNIIIVVSEQLKRGIIEKTYALNKNIIEKEIANENDGTIYLHMFSNFITGLLSEFDDYSKKENIDAANDGFGFSAVPIYATNEELEVYGQKIREILEPAFQKQSDKQKLHTFATIITPPREEDE